MRQRPALYVFVSVLCGVFLVLSGCSSSDSDSTETGANRGEKATSSKVTKGPQLSNSCDLLSSEDILEFFPGASVKITTQGDQAGEALGSRICFYELSDQDMLFVQTMICRTSDMSPALRSSGRHVKDNYFATKEYVEGLVPVDGLGVDAYYGGSGLSAFSGLHILIDEDTALNISVGLGHGNDSDEAHLKVERALAEKIISRL